MLTLDFAEEVFTSSHKIIKFIFLTIMLMELRKLVEFDHTYVEFCPIVLAASALQLPATPWSPCHLFLIFNFI